MASLIGSGRSGQDCTTCSSSGSVPASAAHFAARSSRSAEFAGDLQGVRIPPYPEPVMAFAGALALQALLAGRKVRDGMDTYASCKIGATKITHPTR